MEKRIRDSLEYIGRNIPWLAEQLRMSRRTIYRRLETDGWSYPELKRMKQIFNWETIEG